MSYSVKTLPRFDKNIKKLVKKYPSLKAEFIELVRSLKKNPEQGTLLAIIVIKFGYQLHPKEEGNQEEQGLLPILWLSGTRFFYSPFLINQKKELLQIKS